MIKRCECPLTQGGWLKDGPQAYQVLVRGICDYVTECVKRTLQMELDHDGEIALPIIWGGP